MGLDVAAKLVFPVIVARHAGGIWPLHEDQQDISETVMVEF